MSAVLWVVGVAIVAYGLGRAHERRLALRRAAIALEEWRISRPWLDRLDDHQPVDGRCPQCDAALCEL